MLDYIVTFGEEAVYDELGGRARRVRTRWVDFVQSGRVRGCHASFSGLQ